MTRRQSLSLLLAPTLRLRAQAQVFGSLVPTISAYWCDSVHGSDSNSGTYNAPFQTVAHMASVDAGANKSTWYFVCGSVFQETLVPPRSNMTFASWGTGSQPLFDCSNVISSGSWTKTAGYTNIYQTQVTIQADPVITWVSAWENSTRLLRADTMALCDSTAGSCIPSADVGTGTITVTLYVNTTDSSNPATNGRAYSYSARQYGINNGMTGTTLSGLAARRNLINNGSIGLGGSYSNAYNCTASDGSKHNWYVAFTNNCYNCSAGEAYYGDVGSLSGGQYIMFVYNADNATGLSCYFESCTASCASNSGLGTGFGGHSNDGTNLANILYSNCAAINLDIGFNAGSSDALTMVDCTTLGCTFGISTSGSVVTKISNCSMQGTSSSLTNLAGAVTITGSTLAGGILAALGSADSLSISGGSIISANYCLYLHTTVPEAISVNGVSLTCGGGSQDFYLWDFPGAPGNYSGDNNTFNGGASGSPFNMHGTSYSFSQFKALTGQDQHSTTT